MTQICLYCARDNFELLTTEPLGIKYLVAYLIQQGIANESGICIADNLDEAITFKPDILGISAVSQVIQDARDFAKKCKEKVGCLTVLGGYHVTGIPQKLPEEFDIGVLGEGERTFAEIVSLFKADKLTTEALKQIKGICYHKNGGIVINKPREFIENIDLLPRPYRDNKRYLKEICIFTSRGCPYRCIFCASHKFWGDKYRLRSANSVVSEINYLVNKYYPEEINILDDLWMFNKKRFREIAKELIKLRISEKVSFAGFCRSNLIGEEEIVLLKQMNYRYVRFGTETGSEILLKHLKGNNISITDHQRVIDLCQKYKIPCLGSFMFGVPGETKEDLEATINFLRKNKGKFGIGGFYLFNPIPGTEIWNWMKDKKMISDDFQFEHLQIDFLKKNFSWDNILYFNQDCVLLEEFRKYIEKIKAEFIKAKPNKKTLLSDQLKNHLGKKFTKYARKIYHLFSSTK